MFNDEFGPRRGTRDIFVGREEELGSIANFLRKPSDQKPWVLNLHGEGGLGKTVLLEQVIKRFEELTSSCILRPLYIPQLLDLYYPRNRTRFGLLRSISRALQQTSEISDSENSRGQLTELHERLDRYDRAYTASEILPERLQEMERELVGRFIQVLGVVTEERPLVLFIDTHDKIVPTDLTEWFLEKMVGDSTGHLLALVSGRKPMVPPETDKTLVQHFELGGLDCDAVEEYLQKRGVLQLSDQEVKRLHRLSEGRPILITLAADLQLDGLLMSRTYRGPVDELIAKRFEEALVNRIRDLASPENELVLWMAHVHHRFHAGMLGVLTTGSTETEIDEYEQALEELEPMSFVKFRPEQEGMPDVYMLHDEMQAMVRDYIWQDYDPHDAIRVDLSTRVLGYYDKQLEQEDVPLEERQALEVERLYHRIYADPRTYVKALWDLADEAHNKGALDYLQMLVLEAEKARDHRLHPDPKLNRLLNCLGAWISVHRLENVEARAQFLAVLEKIGEPRAKASALLGLGTVEGRLGRPAGARGYYQQAVELYDQWLAGQPPAEPEYLDVSPDEMWWEQAELHMSIGYTYRRQGDWDQALHHYERGLSVLGKIEERTPEVDLLKAALLTNLGFVLRLQGKNAKARRRLLKALRIAKPQRANLRIAMMTNALGLVYRDVGEYEDALSLFDEVFELLASEGASASAVFTRARALRNIGDVYLRRGEADEALDYFHRSLETYRGRELPNTYNKIGRAYLALKEFDEAEESFRRSIEYANEYDDHHLLVDSLVQMCNLCYQRNEPDRIEEYAQRVREESKDYVFHYHLSIFEQILGDFAFDNDEFENAAEHYSLAIAHGILQSERTYQERDSHVCERLRNIRPKWTEACALRMTEVVEKASWIQGDVRPNIDEKVRELADTLRS